MASANAISSGNCYSVSRSPEDAMSSQSFPFHDETTALAHAPAARVFAYLDDPKALAAHMGESSKMMMGSRMSIDLDAGDGRMIGSKIRMQGSMMGIPLSLEEVITERQAPGRKVWETIGTHGARLFEDKLHYRRARSRPSDVAVFMRMRMLACHFLSCVSRVAGTLKKFKLLRYQDLVCQRRLAANANLSGGGLRRCKTHQIIMERNDARKHGFGGCLGATT